jgi:hypothetical protein
METTTTTHDTTAVAIASPTPQVPPEVLEQVLSGGALAVLTEAQRLALLPGRVPEPQPQLPQQAL